MLATYMNIMDGFTSRCVIVPNPDLAIDEIILPYKALVELLQQTLINMLQRFKNLTYSEAYRIWYKSQTVEDPLVYSFIEQIIINTNGIPVLINRNPTMKNLVIQTHVA